VIRFLPILRCLPLPSTCLNRGLPPIALMGDDRESGVKGGHGVVGDVPLDDSVRPDYYIVADVDLGNQDGMRADEDIVTDFRRSPVFASTGHADGHALRDSDVATDLCPARDGDSTEVPNMETWADLSGTSYLNAPRCPYVAIQEQIYRLERQPDKDVLSPQSMAEAVDEDGVEPRLSDAVQIPPQRTVTTHVVRVQNIRPHQPDNTPHRSLQVIHTELGTRLPHGTQQASRCPDQREYGGLST
jgi:hypothetical protein